MEKGDASSLLHSPAEKQWSSVGIKHHHGLIAPLFSLHTSKSHGIGEYLDLKSLADFCKIVGFNVIQLLPLNDTGLDTSPYSAISAFALNPIYISLSQLPGLEKHSLLTEELKTVPTFLHSMRVSYATVRESKEKFLRHYFQLEGDTIKKSQPYQDFLARSDWLPSYALYKALKIEFHWAGWEHWPNEYQHPTPEQINHLITQKQTEIEWHSFLQFICDQQLHEAKQYAFSQGVFLMGDIPILIGRDSADVWLHRELFHLHYSAGSPPDMYCADGQNWGFPLYNWENLQTQNFEWWKARLKTATRYYDIYRIDHIVGFFRIWAIAQGRLAREGHFIPIDPALWIDHGQKIMFMMLDSCSMLPIGEDLGIIPPSVRTCLQALGISGTKVIRWERNWEGDRSFIPYNYYPLVSMTTVSTHDSETLQLWWKNNPGDGQDFSHFKGWSYQPVLSRQYHQEILWDSHHTSSLFHINLLLEYLAIIPGMTWPNLEDERINQPGIVSENNWTYRFKPSIEELIENQTLTHMMQQLII